MPEFRIAAVLDSSSTNIYVAGFLDWVRGQPGLELVAVLVPRRTPRYPGNDSGQGVESEGDRATAIALSHRAVLWSERLLLKSLSKHPDHLALVDLAACGRQGAGAVPIMPFDETDGLDPDTRPQAQDLALDLLVDFSSLPPCLSILGLSRLGAVRIDYRQERLTPGAPVGFWEAYRRIPKTGFAIKQVTTAGQEVLLLDGSFRTQFSYLLNQAHLYRKSLAQLQYMLATAARTGCLPRARPIRACVDTPLDRPGVAESLSYLNKLAGRVSLKAVRRALHIKQKWAIQVMPGDWRSANRLHASRLCAPAGRFWADPFLRKHHGRTYCFVEDYLYSTDRAHISVLDLTEGAAVDLGIAIKEDFHLSFPFMFEYRGEIYMAPEASQSRQIRIYRSTKFPLEWELCSIGMDGISAADSMFFEHRGRWWLLTSIDRADMNDHCSELCLFHADSPLDGNWTAHPANPVYVDAEAGRNAGLILEGGKIFRAAQMQGFDQYGAGLSIYEIVELDEQRYKEVKLTDLTHVRPARSIGSHHISTTGELTVVDVLQRCFSP
ncbi:glucosamine inositolphosphorylceramide transferase family protein [Massilia alkalitolerans]|uniref:glucosamine inositolphosphorylceramide transferase family protein n=1 Tax=Massilia alkalitolerans TaxID=286638 RepID=UPI0028AB0852|nr:hypothetical protein [Massilia alkalitolerans]